MKTSTFSLLLALLSAMTLNACQSPPEPEPGMPLQRLATNEVRDVLLSHTLTRSGGPLWRRWQYAGTHTADGTMTGQVSWSGGEETAAGVWELSSEGHYCRAWSNKWGGGKRGCFRVSRAGETLVFDHVSGSRGDADRYVYELLPSKPKGP